jgi:hypothetical protein
VTQYECNEYEDQENDAASEMVRDPKRQRREQIEREAVCGDEIQRCKAETGTSLASRD